MGSSQPKTKMLTVRLAPPEMRALASSAAAGGLSKSSYIRLLLALPTQWLDDAAEAAAEGLEQPRVIVLDRATYPALTKQIRAWGYHYDQAVHALNTIQSKRFMSEAKTAEYMDKALRLLAEVDEGRRSLEPLAEAALGARAVSTEV